MPKTNQQAQRDFHARKRAEMGDVAYKALQAAQRQARRQRQNRPATAPTPAAEPAANPAVPGVKKTYVMYSSLKANDPATLTLDDIYKLKSEQSALKNKTIKLVSVKSQYNNILLLHKKLFNSDMINFDFLKDTNKVLTFISTLPLKQSSKDKSIQAISSILSVIPGFKKEYKIYSDITTASSKTAAKVAGDIKHIENYPEWSEIRPIYKAANDIYDMAVMAIYTMIPPRRAQDIALLTLTHSNDNLNHSINQIILNNDGLPTELIFNTYKTMSTYKIQHFYIPKKLGVVLQHYIAKHQLVDGDPLFPTNQNKYYKNFGEVVSNVFSKYTDKKITINTLRHSYIINFLKKKRTPNEKNDLAYSMAHSPKMQSMYDRI